MAWKVDQLQNREYPEKAMMCGKAKVRNASPHKRRGEHQKKGNSYTPIHKKIPRHKTSELRSRFSHHRPHAVYLSRGEDFNTLLMTMHSSSGHFLIK